MGLTHPPVALLSLTMRTRLAVVAVLLVSLAGSASAAEVVPFIEDDYAKAVVQAKAKKLPIFVEAWAPW